VSTASFILSLDCEGKWGVADRLGLDEQRSLSDARLRTAYDDILGLLDEFRVSATFAFVGAFTQSRSGFARIRGAVEELRSRASNYLGPALREIDASGDGWHGDRLVEAVASAGTPHEIALHGVTHVPWTSVGRSFVEAELDLLNALEGPIRGSKTFVFPRNMVAHTDVLETRGFDGFRTTRPRGSRLASLMSEFNLFERPEQVRPGNGIVQIPAGFFVNWRHGLRRIVPKSVTVARAAKLLDRAEAGGQVVHYWLHPENAASAPSTLLTLRSILGEVARRRDAGKCVVLTQLDYCRLAGAAQR
jgi:hypothetical protein